MWSQRTKQAGGSSVEIYEFCIIVYGSLYIFPYKPYLAIDYFSIVLSLCIHGFFYRIYFYEKNISFENNGNYLSPAMMIKC